MSLTARPKRNLDLTKIDDIQSEFFDVEERTDKEKEPENEFKAQPVEKNPSVKNEKTVEAKSTVMPEKVQRTVQKPEEKVAAEFRPATGEKAEQGSQRIADLLATAKTGGVRYTSRPYTVPRSLTIDLTRMKAQFKTRDLHYTQNELMDKMIKESLETVTAENYFDLREKALMFVKSPEQSSRRTVTLTEDAATGMAELKADLALMQNRRISSDEIFTTLLAIGFSTLYENGLL